MRRKPDSIFKPAFAAASALLILLACAAAVSAQQTSSATVSGRVTDPRGAGLPGASVTLYARDRTAEARLSTAADSSGAYRFERVAPGEYVLEAEARGFSRARARVLRVGGSSSQVALDVTLEVAGLSEEVVVTASDAPQTVDEVSKAVDVVGRRELDERDEHLLAEGLRRVPGLRVQQLGGPGAFVSVKARGLRNQDTAVLLDGLRFRDPTGERGDASSLLSDLLVVGAGRVEVLRGTGSSLYGTNAVGGVVNVVTEEGGGPLRGELLAEGGGLGFARGRVRVAGGAGEADRFVYSAALSHLNVTRGVDADDATRNTSGQGRAVFRLAPTATLSARLYAADSFVQLNDDPNTVGTLPASGVVEARPLARGELRRLEAGTPASALDAGPATFIPGANDPDNARAARFFSGALTFAQQATERVGYSVSYHGLATRRSFRDGPAGTTLFEPPGSTDNIYEGRVHTLNARADIRVGPNTVNVGYEFESENFFNRFASFDPSEDYSAEVTERSHAFFVQDQLRLLGERLQLSASFRAQRFALGRPRFDPAGGAPYQNAPVSSPPAAYTGDGAAAYLFRATGTKLRAHVGNGYRAPSLYERFGTFFFFGSFGALGDPRLRPERSLAFDAGLDQTLAASRVRLSATYFYTRLQEVVGFGTLGAADPFGRFSGYLNTGGALARGLELSAELAPAPSLDLFVAYTHTNADERRAAVPGVVRTFGIPDHQLSLVATGRLGRVLLNFDLAASSDYLAPVFSTSTFENRAYRFRGILKGDLGASYAWPLAEARSLRFFGQVENLFGRDYYENGFRTPGRWARAGAALNF